MVKGFKGFNQDLTCRGFQYEICKTYEYDGNIELCSQGFHFCRKLQDVHDFYNLKESRICEIVADGKIIDDDKKSVCARISIIRELSREEIDAAANTGEDNTGVFNSGDRNSGNWNSGYFCACNNSSGVFMSKKVVYEAFNKQLTKEEYDALIESEGFTLLCRFRLCLFKTRTTKNGQKRLACLSYKASWRMFWQKLTPEQKLTIKKMPHFDTNVFYEITGIRLGKLHKEE
jgi:hypothetical protein cdifQCD-6_20855|nr:MAG TPA: pentapeptide repeat protein [Caudoviricetes sp.]